jgi:SARP family transcriptional regulator, regulator of embCAB operon
MAIQDHVVQVVQGGNSMRYEILGPLQVLDEDRASFVSASKIETLLAVLLVRSNQVVTHDQLIAEIWGDSPPRRVRAGLHVYVSQLRKFLSTGDQPECPIVTWPPGYLLRLQHDDLDSEVFLRLVQTGRDLAAQRRDEQARHCFEQALALWRGPVLGDLTCGPILEGFAACLMEARLECTQLLIDCDLRLGHHREVVGRLYALIAEHPLREAFRHQLMLALYRSERTADALMVYQSARRALQDELGLEPCRSLQKLQRAILTADDRLDLGAA